MKIIKYIVAAMAIFSLGAFLLCIYCHFNPEAYMDRRRVLTGFPWLRVSMAPALAGIAFGIVFKILQAKEES